MTKFIVKKVDRKVSKKLYTLNQNNNKVNENNNMMTTEEKVKMAQDILSKNTEETITVKKLKKDKGLIEKVETKKIILNEDNKELLND